MNSPVLSIVIANYNYGRFLADAIESVISQRMGDQIELIVCDAQSTDNSVSVIKTYEKHISWWCSEPDRGQSSAFNKGFWHATGKYLTWLNADDVLVPGCLRKVIHELNGHPECDWFTCNFFRFDRMGCVLEIGWGPHWYPRVLQKPNSPVIVFGPSSIFSKRLWTRVGRVNENLHLTMDTELWIRFMQTGIKQRRVACFVWGFRMHEDSKTAEFGDHKLNRDRQLMFEREEYMISHNTGYKCSKVLLLLTYLLRVFDGSFFMRLFYQIFMRHFNFGLEAPK